MKKTIIAMMISVVWLFTACADNKNTAAVSETTETIETTETAETAAETGADAENAADDDMLKGIYYATISVKDYGDIVLSLDADTAPISVTNFVNLAKDGFYDNLTFHRIISGFMIQGGDPLGNGTGGSEKNIKGEFSSNGIDNPISHKRGVISMARSNDPDSASSQFFIVHQDSEFLDGQYAAFGEVLSGMEIVDSICDNTPVQDSNGTVDAADQPVIEHIVISETQP